MRGIFQRVAPVDDDTYLAARHHCEQIIKISPPSLSKFNEKRTILETRDLD